MMLLCWRPVIEIGITLQASVTTDDLSHVTQLANEIIEAALPVYCTSLFLDDARKIPGIVFLHDEVWAIVQCRNKLCKFVKNQSF